MSVAHSTQLSVVELQTGASDGQSASVMQPTHAPPLSQMGTALGQSELLAQAAWHCASPGQHEGDAVGQSELSVHAPQVPVPVMQIGFGWAQSVLAMHCTQPSVGLHCRLPAHWAVPLTPQRALPVESPLLFAPLQAIAASIKAATRPKATRTPFLLPWPPSVLRPMR
jgi:hypothetical protein